MPDSRPTRADLEEENDRLREALTDLRDQVDDILSEDDDAEGGSEGDDV